jgi:hypothetical protein
MKTCKTVSVLLAAMAAVVLVGLAPRAEGIGVNSSPEVIGTVSTRPGSTLLLPYFEVDLAHPAGRTTRFWINNASATAVLAHVTIWSDLAVPVLAWNVYLTGYDMQHFDMRNILNGTFPATASAGQDPTDKISPHGEFSQDINFASCNGQLPFTQLASFYVDYMQASLTGQLASFNGKCAGTPSSGLARGFITVDTVNNCTLRFPGDPGYFNPGGSGDATDQDVIWGEYVYVNSGAHGNGGHGAPMVAIKASPTDPLTTTAGNYTFYGRLDSAAWSAADNREPLATNFAARYVTGATDVIVWRDPKVAQQGFTCGTLPDWYPLGREGLVLFDEQERATVRASQSTSPTVNGAAFPAATQKVRTGVGQFPIPYQSGWMYLNLNTTVTPQAAGLTDPAAEQAWVAVVRELPAGTFGNVGAAGGPAFRLDSAAAPLHFTP